MEAIETHGNITVLYSQEELAEKMALLKKPFDLDQIEKLPRYTGKKAQNGKIPASAYGYCKECGKRHPLPAVHLDMLWHERDGRSPAHRRTTFCIREGAHTCPIARDAPAMAAYTSRLSVAAPGT